MQTVSSSLASLLVAMPWRLVPPLTKTFGVLIKIASLKIFSAGKNFIFELSDLDRTTEYAIRRHGDPTFFLTKQLMFALSGVRKLQINLMKIFGF